jgi:repressor LexA
MLTRKQYELLVYLDKELRKKGVSPSFDEMKDALGLKSKSGIHRLITGLEERGFIRRLPHRARAIEVLRLPDNMDGPVAKAGQKTTGKRFAANVIEGDFKLAGVSPVADSESVQLPLYGRIAAGTPIEALRDHSNAIGIPADMIGKG